jgi:hypothetical protein
MIKKKSLKKNDQTGEFNAPAAPVELVDGKLQPLDPNSIGNGSIANLILFQHEYEYKGKKGMTSMLTRVQIIKHVVYVPKPMEEFEEAETETVLPQEENTPTETKSIAPPTGKVF